jgi:hypothetical protein
MEGCRREVVEVRVAGGDVRNMIIYQHHDSQSVHRLLCFLLCRG